MIDVAHRGDCNRIHVMSASPLATAAAVRRLAACLLLIFAAAAVAAPRDPFTLDRDAQQWVDDTFRTLTPDEKIGQLIVPAFDSNFVSTDSDTYDALSRLVRDYHVGGFHVFGASIPAPSVLLNAGYGTVILGQPFSAASLINRLQTLSKVPLLNTADFETGVGFRISGATSFPRQMAMGAIAGADGERLVREEARITAIEAGALGVQVNFAPVADVNNNPRNPVINIRSYGEDPARVAALVAAYVGGAKSGGMIATVKHFPGHGDTDVDSHLGLPVVSYDRRRLQDVEFVPFRRGIDEGVEAVMAAHIELPSLDPAPQTPATFSRPILHDLLRQDLGFAGLVYTDSMSMDAVAKMVSPGEGAVRALAAGADQVLHSPDPIAAFNGIRQALATGRLSQPQIDGSVRRVLRAKAAVGLHRRRTVDLEALPSSVGGRAHDAAAADAFTRAVTLVKDDRHQVPLTIARDAPILYLSVVDYPSGWQIAAPSRTFIPELKKRWPQVTAIEVSDHTSMSDLDVVRALVPRYGAVVASVFVRSTSGSGRLDLAAELVRLLKDLARIADRSTVPLVTVFFGNPYTASFVPELPAMLLTYDFYDQAERAAVRAIAGDAPVSGRLPVTLSPQLRAGFGLDRAPRTPPQP
jgi:beta-N-acetylhexosaminidase